MSGRMKPCLPHRWGAVLGASFEWAVGRKTEGTGEAVESILLTPPISYLYLLGTVVTMVVNFAIKYFKKTPES